MSKTRIESDSMGEITVPADKYWEHKPSARFITLI